jgi:indole-3-glycerol phosphate synthase
MILDKIAAKTKKRVKIDKARLSLAQIKELAQAMPNKGNYPFRKALSSPTLSYICEIKRASPSLGLISEDFDYLQIAKDYQAAGAAAISCLTEPYYFQGNDSYLQQIAQVVDIPVLRKDFIIDCYMIYQAKVIGASAILLICAILDEKTLTEYIALADSLGLDSLVEAHDEIEIKMAINAGAKIIGINNRNLQTFTIDMNTSILLRNMVPESILFVSESGIRNSYDIELLEANGTDAVLIGETLMREADKKAALAKLGGKQL